MSDKNFKIDLHTHSIISYDGGISKKQYENLLNDGVLDYVAITDHNQISFAKMLRSELGEKIIVGEEIKSTDGEIIGLFLNTLIPSGMSALETVDAIHNDGGLVYIPHPFETGRSSLQEKTLNNIISNVDVLEVFNARGKFRGKPQKAYDFAIENKISMAASSDAHCKSGIGTSLSIIQDSPKNNQLSNLLKNGTLQKNYAPLHSLLCPGFYKIKNRLFL